MILSAGLKVYLLVLPSHCPVDLPAKLAVEVFKEIEVTLVTATALKLSLGAILVNRGDGGKVGVALGAEDAYRVVLCSLGIVLCLQLLLALGLVLSLEGVENIEDLASHLERVDKIVAVLARAVHIRLITAIKLDAEGLDTLKELLLKVLCIVFVTAPGVGNVNVRATDILVVSIANNRLDVCGDLTATVELVPGNDKASLFALLFKSLDYEKRSCQVSEVTYMNGTRGADACSANVFLLVGMLLNQLFCNFF